MGIKIEIKGLDELNRQLRDPKIIAGPVEATFKKRMHPVVKKAIELCPDPELASRFECLVAYTEGEIKISLVPNEGNSYFIEALRICIENANEDDKKLFGAIRARSEASL